MQVFQSFRSQRNVIFLKRTVARTLPFRRTSSFEPFVNESLITDFATLNWSLHRPPKKILSPDCLGIKCLSKTNKRLSQPKKKKLNFRFLLFRSQVYYWTKILNNTNTNKCKPSIQVARIEFRFSHFVLFRV